MRAVLVAFAAGLLICAPVHAERLTNAALGLSIEKPNDWCVLSASEIANDHQLIEMNNPAMEEALRRYSSPPLFAFFRCKTDHEGVAATVKVGTTPADPSGQESARDILRGMLQLFSKLVRGVNVLAAPETVTLAGRPSGYMALSFALKANGKPSSVASETWAICRGKYFIIVGATYPPNDDAGARAAVKKIVNSLRLTN